MNLLNYFSLLALALISYAALCQSCGIPDLMNKGKSMQKKAEGWCKNGMTDAQKAKVKECSQKEFDAAKGKPYHEYLEKAAKKCLTDDMMKDPCSKETRDKGQKCAKDFMGQHPELKSKAMSWIGPHCKDFVAHIERLDSCVG